MARNYLTEDQFYNMPIDQAETMYGLQYPNQQQEFLDFLNSRRNINDLGFIPMNVSQNPAMVNYGIMGTDQANMFTEDYDEEYVPMPEEKEKQPGGIAKLFEFISNFTPFGLARRGLESLRGLNQRIQQSDFGQSKTLADYFDARKYGGRQARDDAAARNMAQARGLQKKIDRGEFNTGRFDRGITDRNRGNYGNTGGGNIQGSVSAGGTDDTAGTPF